MMKASRAAARSAQAVEEMAAQLQRIEDKLDKILSLQQEPKSAVKKAVTQTAGKK